MSLRTSPSVEGRGARRQAWRHAAAYTWGSAAGGMALGAVVSASASVSGVPRSAWLAAAGALAAVLFVAAILGVRVPVPQRRWQVPRKWFVRFGGRAFAPAGFTLSLGVFTPILFPTFYLMLLLFATLNLVEAVGVGFVYGVFRSIGNWIAAVGPVSAGPAGLSEPGAIARRYALVQKVSPPILVCVAAILLATLVAG